MMRNPRAGIIPRPGDSSSYLRARFRRLRADASSGAVLNNAGDVRVRSFGFSSDNFAEHGGQARGEALGQIAGPRTPRRHRLVAPAVAAMFAANLHYRPRSGVVFGPP